MKYANFTVLTGSDAASIIGSKIDSSQLVSASFHGFFTDAAVAGAMKIQVSNDPCPINYLPANFTPTHWVDLPSATATVTAGAAVVIPLPQITYRWMRVVVTQSSVGTGTTQVNMFSIAL